VSKRRLAKARPYPCIFYVGDLLCQPQQSCINAEVQDEAIKKPLNAQSFKYATTIVE
jgi:hypothetical protein